MNKKYFESLKRKTIAIFFRAKNQPKDKKEDQKKEDQKKEDQKKEDQKKETSDDIYPLW